MTKNTKGKIITTYLANAKNIPNGYLKVLIMRKPFAIPRGFMIEKDLGPLEMTHDNYKETKDWETFKDAFEGQLEYDTDTKKALAKVASLIEKGMNIALICCEKDYLHCHRHIEGEWFKDKGVEVSELQGKEIIPL